MPKLIKESVSDWVSSLTGSDLKIESKNKEILISGTYFVCFYYERFEKELTDTFELKIHVPLDYPNNLPQIEEVSGKIPKDFHMNGNYFCLEVPIAMHLYANKHSIGEFISEFLDSFLSAFMWHKSYGFFPNGDRSHGSEGVYEQLAEYFKIDNPKEVISLLSLAKGYKYKRNDPCPCGCGKKYKACHLNKVEELKINIPIGELTKTYKEMVAKYGEK